MEKEAVINQKVRDFSKQTDIIQTVVIFLVAFLVPTFLGNLITKVFGKTSVITSNSQLIVGSIVNVAAMSTTQLITATIGAGITYVVYVAEKKSLKEWYILHI